MARIELQAVLSAKDQMTSTLKSVGGGIVSLGKIALAAGGSIAGMGGVAIKAASQFETMGVSLETAFQGNKQAAADAKKQIIDFAAKTPYELEEVMRSFVKLKNMGLKPSQEALRAYGDTASAMGKSLNDMVEAVADAATGEFERLKEFGIRSSAEGNKVKFTFQGVTTTVGKNSKEIEDYLIKLGKTKFAGGMESQSRTLSGLMSTLKDTINITLATLAEKTGIFDIAKKAVGKFGDMIDRNKDKLIALVSKGVGIVIEKVGEFIDLIKTIRGELQQLGSVIYDKAITPFKEWIIQNLILNGKLDELRTKYLDPLIKTINGLGDTINTRIISPVQNWIAQNGGLIGSINAARDTVVTFIGRALTPFKPIIDDIQKSFQTMRDRLGEVRSKFGEVEGGGKLLQGVLATMKVILGGVVGVLLLMVDGALKTVNVLLRVISAVLSVGSAMKSAWDTVKYWWGQIVSFIGKGLKFNLDFFIPDWVKERINGFIGKYNSIPLLPDIPYLAKGGIVTRPTLAMIGESGPEAVVPLGNISGMDRKIEIHFNDFVVRNDNDPRMIAEMVKDILNKELQFNKMGS